ncbi:MAG: hypothetical protein ACTSRV_15125 [Candidatus Freyarchaeota archaeon]|nr:hypothetical protein [Candidatus Freyarchaeota archaeon]
MTLLDETYSEYIQPKKLRDYILQEKGRIKPLEPDHTITSIIQSLLIRHFTTDKPVDITNEIISLKKRVLELERILKERNTELETLKKRVGGKRKPTKADYVYELFKEELEKEHFGKIVAIDTELKKIVGIGDTVLEAYRQAKKNTGKDQFDFRRVGYSYIHRV